MLLITLSSKLQNSLNDRNLSLLLSLSLPFPLPPCLLLFLPPPFFPSLSPDAGVEPRAWLMLGKFLSLKSDVRVSARSGSGEGPLPDPQVATF